MGSDHGPTASRAASIGTSPDAGKPACHRCGAALRSSYPQRKWCPACKRIVARERSRAAREASKHATPIVPLVIGDSLPVHFLAGELYRYMGARANHLCGCPKAGSLSSADPAQVRGCSKCVAFAAKVVAASERLAA